MRESTKRALEAATTRLMASGAKLDEHGLKYHSPGRWVGFAQYGLDIMMITVRVDGEEGVVTVWQLTHTWTSAVKGDEPSASKNLKKGKKKDDS